jgi:hypothetical protein
MSCFPQPPKNKEYFLIVNEPEPVRRTPNPSRKKAPNRPRPHKKCAGSGRNHDIDHEGERGTLMNADLLLLLSTTYSYWRQDRCFSALTT